MTSTKEQSDKNENEGMVRFDEKEKMKKMKKMKKMEAISEMIKKTHE